MIQNKDFFKQFEFIQDYDTFLDKNKNIYKDKPFQDNVVRALYINVTNDTQEINRYISNKPCKLPSKIGLCTWDMKKYPGLNGLYESYYKNRGRNTGYANDMITVLIYPFNRYITHQIDKLIIKLLESIHRDMNQDVSFIDETQNNDPRCQRCGTEFIKNGLIQKYIQLTMFIIRIIDDEIYSDELIDLCINEMSKLSECSKNLIYKIKTILRDKSNTETDESITSFIDQLDFSISTNMLYKKFIDNSIIFKYIPDNYDLNHNCLIYSFDKHMTTCAINKIISGGYVSNVNVVELTNYEKDEYKTYKNINIIYKNDYTSKFMATEFNDMNCLILNPPYKGDLYKKFLINAYDNMSPTGKMMFICPAAFLNDQRYNKNDKNQQLRKKIEPHVVKIIIENLNSEFGTRNNHPFAIIYIDKTKKDKKIEFICNNIRSIETNIDDCNINGSSKIQMSIQKKMMNYTLLGKDRLIKKYDSLMPIHTNKHFIAVNEILTSIVSNSVMNKDKNNINGLFYSYLECYVHHNVQRVIDYNEMVHYRYDNKYNYFFYGTEEEMNNWLYNSMNLKLMKAFSIIRFWDQHNQVFNTVPFLCDKKYTDDELYSIFNITDEEISYIDELLNKYDMNGEWFQRYISGQDVLKSYKLL